MTFNACPPDSVNLPETFCATPSPDSPAAVGPTATLPQPQSAVPLADPHAAAASTEALNVLGEPLALCGCSPMTGWFRDGLCRTNGADVGRHTVCCVMDERFLSYTKAQGNDLSTPRPEFQFPGLKPGDHWCVCASRWLEAHDDGIAPPVLLEACEQSTLVVIPLAVLQSHAWRGG